MRVRPTPSFFVLTALFLSISFVFLMPQSVAQQNIVVRLESPDGSVKLQGRFIEIEDGFYVLETAAGNPVKADARWINCVSVICPDYSTMASSSGQ